MNFRQHFLVVVTGLFVLSNFACAGKIKSADDAEVVFDDGYQTAKKHEIIFDDLSFDQISQRSSKPGAHEEKPFMLNDNSVLSVMFDAFGNKVETREFPIDPRILMLTVTTSIKGKQEIIVRGRSGERKILPPEMLDRILTIDANEIARIAEIFEPRREISLPPITAMQQKQPEQIYQPAQLQPISQPVEENITEKSPPDEVEQKPVEKKVEKGEEMQQQNSIQKDAPQLVTREKKETNK